MRRAIIAIPAVNHGKRRTLSRPSSTTRSTSNAANVSVQRIWTAEKPKFKCIGTLSGLGSGWRADPLPGEDPIAYVPRLAREKAEAVFRDLTDASPKSEKNLVVLGADTTVAL